MTIGGPWGPGSGAPRSADVNLVEGTTFVISARSGSVGDEPAHGLFVLDTRIISRWSVEVLDWNLAPLVFAPMSPFSGTFVSRVERPGDIDAPMVVVQRRHVGGTMREDLEIRNHGPARDLVVRLHVGTDLAGLFDVKAGNGGTNAHRVRSEAVDHGLVLTIDEVDGSAGGVPVSGTAVTSVAVTSTEPPGAVDIAGSVLSWAVRLDAGARWSTCLVVTLWTHGGASVGPTHPCDVPIDEGLPTGRMRRWRDRIATSASDDAWFDRAVDVSLDDLGSLRIFDPEHPDRVVVAAGSPWFMALFGRDSLLTSWMTLPFDQELALGVLAELADTQGRRHHELTDEQPGRILHEVRFDPLSAELLGGANRYYGTVDATPLFVMLVAEVARWTGATERVQALLPAVDRALEWIDRWGDRDGDGFVEYERSHERGLLHQGWKDSWDGIRHEDGSVAEPPIALCEVQGYVYGAYRARAALARDLGDAVLAVNCDERADELARRFDEVFWLPDVEWYAVALDADKRPVRSLTSNLGHLLWTGIVSPERARRLASVLGSPQMFTGFGLRTLASDHAGYNPLSYHCGSVWPHDTAIAVAGLARYGFDAEATTLANGLLGAARAGDGRLPELFGGFARDDIGSPVPYPSSCSPQAWAAGAPLLVLRSLLGLDPDVPNGRLDLRPRLPASMGRVRMHGIPIGGHSIDLVASGREATVTGTDLTIAVH